MIPWCREGSIEKIKSRSVISSLNGRSSSEVWKEIYRLVGIQEYVFKTSSFYLMKHIIVL